MLSVSVLRWAKSLYRRFTALWCCTALCRHRRRRKEKGLEERKKEDEDLEDPKGGRVVFPVSWRGEGGAAPSIEIRAPGNGQDADEADVEGLLPELVVECARRPGARIHKGTSLILPDAGGDLISSIVAHLPVLQQIRPCWHLGYSMAVDGVSLRTLYRQVMEAGPCLLIVEDSNCCVFGAFASEGLRPLNRCHGTHESFLFRLPKSQGAWRTEIFRWSQQSQESQVPADDEEAAQGYSGARASYFEALQAQHCSTASSPAAVYCDYTGIVIGIDGPAIFIDQDLLRGVSCPSKVFSSPCMAAIGPDFVVRNLEVWHWTG